MLTDAYRVKTNKSQCTWELGSAPFSSSVLRMVLFPLYAATCRQC